jgi:hypothetical protein
MTQKIQENFSNIIKEQKANNNKRLSVYQTLFFNNIKSFIDNTFVVSKKSFSNKSWNTIIEKFMKSYQSNSPYFKDISEEFFNFFKKEYKTQPYILELMEYELLELKLFVHKNDFNNNYTFSYNSSYVINNLSFMKHYKYPVQKMNGLDIPNKQDTFIIIYRNYYNEVKFMEINNITFAILEELANKTLNNIIIENKLNDNISLYAEDLIRKLLNLGVLKNK